MKIFSAFLTEGKPATKASLEARHGDVQKGLAEVQDEITDLIKYLQSSKFSSGDLAGYVNRNDILPRLTAMRVMVGDLQDS